MVQSAKADVVSPAIAADDPHTLAHQRVGDRLQGASLGSFRSGNLCPECKHPLPLRLNPGFLRLVGAQNGGHQFVADDRRQPPQQAFGIALLLIEGQAHAHTEFRIVFKQRVRPGGAASALILGIRRGRQVAAVDRRAARGVGDVQPVAEKLGQQLQVRRLAAARAGAGEFKQRVKQLYVLDLRMRQAIAIDRRQSLEEVPVLYLRLAQRRLHLHVDCLVLGFALALHWADLDA